MRNNSNANLVSQSTEIIMNKQNTNASMKYLAGAAAAMFLFAGHAHSADASATADVGAEPQLSMSEADLDQFDGAGLKLKDLNAVVRLVRVNMRIYGVVGWEYGRWEAKRKYGVDIGRYPGWNKVMSDSFWRRF